MWAAWAIDEGGRKSTFEDLNDEESRRSDDGAITQRCKTIRPITALMSVSDDRRAAEFIPFRGHMLLTMHRYNKMQ